MASRSFNLSSSTFSGVVRCRFRLTWLGDDRFNDWGVAAGVVLANGVLRRQEAAISNLETFSMFDFGSRTRLSLSACSFSSLGSHRPWTPIFAQSTKKKARLRIMSNNGCRYLPFEIVKHTLRLPPITMCLQFQFSM